MQSCPHCQFPLLRASESCGWCGAPLSGKPSEAADIATPMLPQRMTAGDSPLPCSGSGYVTRPITTITMSEPLRVAPPDDMARMAGMRWLVVRVLLRSWVALCK